MADTEDKAERKDEKKENPFAKKDEDKKDDSAKDTSKSEDKTDDKKDSDSAPAKSDTEKKSDEPFAKKWRSKAKEVGADSLIDGFVSDDTPDDEAKALYENAMKRIEHFLAVTHSAEEVAQELENVAAEVRSADGDVAESSLEGDGVINTPTEVAGALELASEPGVDKELQEFEIDVDGNGTPDANVEVVDESPAPDWKSIMAIPSDEELSMPRDDGIQKLLI